MRVGPLPRGGYFLWLLLAYAVGLLFANIAVVIMNRGQPALLYIVPAILSTTAVTGWNEFKDLWKGPKVFLWADRLIYYSHTGTLVLEDDATAAESIEDEDDEEHEETAVRPIGDNASRRDFT